MILQRLYYPGFILAGLSVATLVYALPAPSDLSSRSKRNMTTRARSTPAPVATARQPATQRSRPSTIVVIDAGHGGFDRGGIPGQRVAEKTMNLDVAQRLRVVLQANGYRVVMTRDSDVFVPLGTRVAIANSYRNAIFVCIHFNSARRTGANGIETYFYSSQSLPLASAIHYYVAGGAPSSNRGVRRRGYYVLRRTTIPAVLVECGFLTNPSEAQYAQSATYREKLAEEIARGIRGRSQVATTASSTRVTAAEAVPLQPFIDQTRVRDPDLLRSKRSARKTSKGKSSRHKNSSDSSDSDTQKRSSKKKKSSQSSGDESSNKEKKSMPKQSGD